MIASGIVINWESGTEYIQMDTGAPTKTTVITTTREWWLSERRFVQYNTISSVRKLEDGTAELVLSYKHSVNQHILREDAYWGESTILFKPNSTEGLATWQDFDYPENNGTVHWQRLSGGLFKKSKREYYSRLKREQDMFRAAIFTCEQCCTLSGERTTEALEAAHIISSKDGGAEVIENGILLRADLHKLYDSGRFLIDPSGHVTGLTGVSAKYRKLLNGARLPDPTVARVKEALLYRWKEAPQPIAVDPKNCVADSGVGRL